MLTTQEYLEAYPTLAADPVLLPLLQRMAVIKGVLRANVQVQADTSTTRADLLRLHGQQAGLLDEVRRIKTQLDAIATQRSMEQSMLKLERGMVLLGVHRE